VVAVVVAASGSVTSRSSSVASVTPRFFPLLADKPPFSFSAAPAAPAAGASVVLFATHPCNLGTGGASYQSKFANRNGQAILIEPDAIETVNLIYVLHDKAS
jgi:hypothetical protein